MTLQSWWFCLAGEELPRVFFGLDWRELGICPLHLFLARSTGECCERFWDGTMYLNLVMLLYNACENRNKAPFVVFFFLPPKLQNWVILIDCSVKWMTMIFLNTARLFAKKSFANLFSHNSDRFYCIRHQWNQLGTHKALNWHSKFLENHWQLLLMKSFLE